MFCDVLENRSGPVNYSLLLFFLDGLCAKKKKVMIRKAQKKKLFCDMKIIGNSKSVFIKLHVSKTTAILT